jgi:aspartate aminotransferase-like enzyme
VFHHDAIVSAPDRLPRYLDLGYYAEKEGIPFTLCSNLLYALKRAVEQLDVRTRFAEIQAHHARVRKGLTELELEVVAPASHSTGAVLTIALPNNFSAVSIGDALAEAGILISYRSDYLLDRNWIQICLMGRYDRATVDRLLATLARQVRGAAHLKPRLATAPA